MTVRHCRLPGPRRDPRSVEVGAHLFLDGCTGLTGLPVRTRVRGSLYVPGCTALVALPPGLRVDGDLRLEGREALGSLPDDLRVEGTVFTPDGASYADLDSTRARFEGRPPPVRPDRGAGSGP